MRSSVIFVLALFLLASSGLLAQPQPQPIAYDLSVRIEPDAGSLAVQGSVEFIPENPAAETFQFDLHETLEIKKLVVNGKEATFTFGSPVGPFPLAASRGVIVAIPAGVSRDRI